ncbi:MAG: serine/threonine-protein kinase [Pseudobdellovibrio sp.]
MAQSYEQFGKYLLLEKVAAGGMAEIYLARSGAANGLNKFFAIKRILPQFSTNEDFVAMFKEEAKVAINLNHSNVVSIYDFGIELDQFFIVMDYVEGRNLRQIINELKKSNKSFSIDQALFLIKETAAGLDHAHRCTDSTNGRPLNITHRDMSPQNIMVSFEGEVKVIDFGIAKSETEAEGTKAGTLKGKFSYMSPEQAEGQPIDPRTDVFALGIVLWELLANDRLFTGSNEAAILRKVRDCQVPLIRKINPTVPQELERIVMKALAKDRNVRYQTAANFHRDLNRFLNTQYPDFSPQDFSQFVRESFKSAYQEGRDKLVTYSKIVVEEPPLLKAPPVTKVAASPAGADKAPDNRADEVPDVPTGFAAPDEKVKINLEGLRSSASPRSVPSTGFNKPLTIPTPTSQTKLTQLSQVSFTKSPTSSGKSAGEFTDILFKGLMVAALSFAGWWGYKNYFNASKPPFRDIAVKDKNKNPKANPDEVQKTDFSSTAAVAEIVKISVNSNPDGAQVYVNGVDTGSKTPAVVSLPTGKDSEVLIKKEGYLEYKVNRVFSAGSQGTQVIATLQSSVATAYINIKVSDGNSFTKISINGRELLEKPPVLKYPVVASKENVISAYNPITKLTDEVRVTVKPGEALDVQLVLGRGHKK